MLDPCENVFVYWFNIWIVYQLDLEGWTSAGEWGGCKVDDFGEYSIISTYYQMLIYTIDFKP